jgi:hypothetical protein
MSEIRIADSDRERVVERLRRAAGEGRLDTEELEHRAEAALRSRTDRELARLTADLPAVAANRRETPRRDHRLAFAVAAPGMVAIWALTGADYFWPMWPILGWGSAFFLKGRRPRGRTVAA